MKKYPSILTNMAFWQSSTWCESTSSIYDIHEATRSKQDPHFLPAWREARELLRRRKDYDVIVTLGARTSLLYGILCIIGGVPSKQIMTEVFIDAPQQHNPLWHIKNYCYRLVARRSVGILTNSREEIHTMSKRYGIPKKRLRFVSMHSNITKPCYIPPAENSVVCAGRTLRDYDTMIRAANLLSNPVTIICGKEDVVPPAPPNVMVHREIERVHYLEILGKCTIVALPLLDTQRSTGQVVLLEAMAYGKPVVTTDSPGTRDHIRESETGFLVPVGDAEELAKRINILLDSPEVQERIGKNAVEEVRNKYLVDIHAQAKLDAIEDLWKSTHQDSQGTAIC